MPDVPIAAYTGNADKLSTSAATSDAHPLAENNYDRASNVGK
jgi:hypothetical protein